MLDLSDANHSKFIEEFSKKVTCSAKINSLAPPGMVAYKKKDEFDQQSIGARPKSSKEQSRNNSSNKENSNTDQKRSRIHGQNRSCCSDDRDKFISPYLVQEKC